MAPEAPEPRDPSPDEITRLRDRVRGLEQERDALVRFRGLLDQSEDMLAIVEPETGLLLDFNRRLSDLLGYSRAELLEMTVPDFDTGIPDPEAWRGFVTGLRTEGSQSLESVLRCRDGREFPVDVRVSYTETDGVGRLVVVSREISTRKAADEALRRSRALWRSLIDATHDLVYLLDRDGGIRELNRAAAERLGQDRDVLLGSNVFSYFDPATATARRAQLEQCVASRQVLHAADEREGEFFETTIYPMLDGSGEVESLAVFVSDVTAHRALQEELNAERRFIESALDASSDTFFVFDVSSGQPVRWNRVFREVTGYSDEEIARMKAPDDFYEAPDLVAAQGALQELAATGHARVELPLLTRDGRKIPYEYVVAMLESGSERPLACSVGRDVAERSRAEEAVRRSEEKHRGFLESLSAGVVAHGPDARILYWNKMSLDILGLTADEMRGSSERVPELHFLHEDGSVMEMDDYPAVLTLRTGRDLKGYVVGIMQPDTGDVSWVICNSHCIRDTDGLIEHVLISFLDITALKEASEERRSLEAQILHAQKLESLGVLAGGIAHDFNNLLMAILGNSDLALHELGPGAPARRNIEEIGQAARRAAGLAQQMLAYSGRGRFVVAPVDLNAIVTEMLNLFEASISKKVALSTRLAPDLPPINADATQIQQVVMNLITNASEAIGETGEGRITFATGVLDCDADDLAASYLDEDHPPGRYVFVEVRDTGCGMDAKTLESLFDPFFTTKFTGRGLGLAAVLGIVRGHEGAIIVDSRPGEGTVFRVLFPVGVEALPEPAETDGSARGTAWRGAGTVLVVDDEEAVRNVACRMVERLGFATREAPDGVAAVAEYRRHADSIVCVLLDVTMPRMDGEEACREIKSLDPDAVVVLSSGFNEAELSSRFREYGFDGFIKKPYELDDLGCVMEQVLGEG